MRGSPPYSDNRQGGGADDVFAAALERAAFLKTGNNKGKGGYLGGKRVRRKDRKRKDAWMEDGHRNGRERGERAENG